MTKNYLQGKLTAGSGITIDSSDNTISAKIGNGLEIDENGAISLTATKIITVTAGQHGTVLPKAGDVPCAIGKPATFNFIPDSDYYTSFSVDGGAAVTAVNTYTFDDVQTEHTLNVQFIEKWKVTTSVTGGEGGTISQSGTGRYNPEEDVVITVTPADGYKVDTLKDNGTEVAVSSENTYTITNISADHTVEVKFRNMKAIYLVSIPKGSDTACSITCDDTRIDVSTQDARFTIIKSMCRHCLVTSGLASVKYVKEDNFGQYLDGTTADLTGSEGDFMLEVDKIWYTTTSDTNNWIWKFTLDDMSESGWECAHLFNGTYREHIYYGVFNGYSFNITTDPLHSHKKTANYPTNTKTIEQFYQCAKLGGETYHIENMPQRMLMIGLHLFLYGTKNIQSVVNGRNCSCTSGEACMEYISQDFDEQGGWTQGVTGTDYTQNCMTMGIMNYYGKQWQFMGETMFLGNSSGTWKFAKDANDHYNIINGSSGIPSTWTVVNAGTELPKSRLFVKSISGSASAPFIPVTIGGDSTGQTTYFCDAAWSNTGDRCCLSGADVHYASGIAGLFAFAVDAVPSYSAWNIGARLLIHGGV